MQGGRCSIVDHSDSDKNLDSFKQLEWDRVQKLMRGGRCSIVDTKQAKWFRFSPIERKFWITSSVKLLEQAKWFSDRKGLRKYEQEQSRSSQTLDIVNRAASPRVFNPITVSPSLRLLWLSHHLALDISLVFRNRNVASVADSLVPCAAVLSAQDYVTANTMCPQPYTSHKIFTHKHVRTY